MVSGPKGRKLTDDERLALYDHLLSKSVNLKLPDASIRAAAEWFNVHPRTVTLIWKRRLYENDDVALMSAIGNRKKDRVGSPSIDTKIVNDALVSVPAQHCQTLRHASAGTVVSISTLWRVLERGEI